MASSKTELPISWASGSLWDLTGRVQVVTFIGAGGKTTCLRAITREIETAGHRVIATTTTKVYPEEQMQSWKNDKPPDKQEGACFWYAKVEDKTGKWVGPPVPAVDAAIESASPRTVPDLHWVIEGDGAKGLKLKCWEPHEPQIPTLSDCVVLVLDGGLWGKVLQEDQVHRPAGCPDLLGQVWNAEQAWHYFLRSPVFAPRYEQMFWVILLNCHEENAGNEDPSESVKSVKPLELLEPLLELSHRWSVIQQAVKALEYQPNHLRIAAGDAKGGELQWLDLW